MGSIEGYMKFEAWLNKNKDLKDSAFVDSLKRNSKRYEALCKLDYPEKTWDNLMIPPSKRFAEDQLRKAKIAEEKKKAKADMKGKNR